MTDLKSWLEKGLKDLQEGKKVLATEAIQKIRDRLKLK